MDKQQGIAAIIIVLILVLAWYFMQSGSVGDNDVTPSGGSSGVAPKSSGGAAGTSASGGATAGGASGTSASSGGGGGITPNSAANQAAKAVALAQFYTLHTNLATIAAKTISTTNDLISMLTKLSTESAAIHVFLTTVGTGFGVLPSNSDEYSDITSNAGTAALALQSAVSSYTARVGPPGISPAQLPAFGLVTSGTIINYMTSTTATHTKSLQSAVGKLNSYLSSLGKSIISKGGPASTITRLTSEFAVEASLVLVQIDALSNLITKLASTANSLADAMAKAS